jgi:hypothetical protein
MFPRVLRREVLFLLAAKAALLLGLYLLFFSPAHRPTVTPERLQSHILDQTTREGSSRGYR